MNQKPVIIGTGLSGLVGSRLVALLQDEFSFYNLDLTQGVDITNPTQVEQKVATTTAAAFLHCAAFTDVNQAWEQRGDKHGACWKVNVVGTEVVATVAARHNLPLIHLSTAFVFDGTSDSMYREEDALHPIEWYGETKARAEEIVQQVCQKWTIVRLDQPFRSDPFPKLDTTHKLLQAMLTGRATPFADHWFSPTIIEDLAPVVRWLAAGNGQGIWHATCGEKYSDLEYARLLATVHHLPQPAAGSLTAYLQKVQRPYQRNTALSSDKLRQMLPAAFTSLEAAVQRVEFSRPESAHGSPT